MPGQTAALDQTKLLAARYRAAASRPYLTSALYALTIVPSNGVPTMGVDRHWRCYVSPAFVDATDASELAGVWIHEAAHLLRDHHGRADRLPDGSQHDRLRVNIAQDCEINDDLIADGLALPADRVEPRTFGLPAGKLFEEYLPQIPPQTGCTTAAPAPTVARRTGRPTTPGDPAGSARSRPRRYAGTPPKRCAPTSAAGALSPPGGNAGPTRSSSR